MELDELQRFLLSLGQGAGNAVNSVMGAGADEAEAARIPRLRPQVDMREAIAQGQARLDAQNAIARQKEIENQMQMEAIQQKEQEAQRQSDAREQAFSRNVAVMGQGGQSRAYAVPEDMQNQLGEYYLTNAILPTRNTPVSPRSVENGRNIPNAPLTPESEVDFGRVASGDYEKQYSTGEPAPVPKPADAQDMEMRQMVAAGLMTPKDYYAAKAKNKEVEIKATEDKSKSGRDFQVVETPEGQSLLDKTTGELKPLGIPNKLPSAATKKIEDQTNLLAYLKRIKENYQAAGSGSSGPIDARLGWAKERVGGLSPAEITLRKDVADFQDRILRERSGAAITESEAERLRGFTPDLYMNDQVFKQRIDDVIAATEDILKTTVDQARNRGQVLDKTPQQGQSFDADKEARYQAWKAKRGIK